MFSLSPTAQKIQELPYVELLALLGESNRPPGGINTVRQLVVNCHLRPGVHVLHSGCNAGFLSRELARRSGCEVIGIDISKAMVESANQRALLEGLDHLVHHEHHDMRNLHSSMSERTFDVVLSGGALAFVEGQRQAVEQWLKVVSPFGLLADAELFYRESPPISLLQKVSEAIGVNVPQYDQQHWHSIFTHDHLEPYYSYSNAVITRSSKEIQQYCEKMVEFSGQSWSTDAKEILLSRLLYLFNLFNENLKYMNYEIFVYRYTSLNPEPALYV